MKVPRNAHDQYIFSKKISKNQLQPENLAFLAKHETPNKIFHVMIYLGNEQWLEATSDSMNVRIVTMDQKLMIYPTGVELHYGKI